MQSSSAGSVFAGLGRGLLAALLLTACAGDDGAAGSETEGAGTGTAVTGGTTTGASTDATTDDGATTASTTTTTTATASSTATTTAGTGGEPLDCAALPLCDGFEDAAPGGPPDAARWEVVSPNCSGLGALEVDGDVAYAGARSLRVDGAGGYCDHIFIANSAAVEAITAEGGAVYGRLFVRFSDPLGQGHVTFLTLRDEADGGRDLRMGGQSEILMWNRESDDATLPSLSPAGIALSRAPAAGTWTCVEFMIDEDAGEIATWVDGEEVAGLRVDAEPTPDVDQQWHQKAMWRPSLSDLKFGWESYAGQSMTLWFDEVALAGARIGCD
ncbi:MAG: hypothetical protein R3A79_14805 [Nannocystaceae bacterium]